VDGREQEGAGGSVREHLRLLDLFDVYESKDAAPPLTVDFDLQGSVIERLIVSVRPSAFGRA